MAVMRMEKKVSRKNLFFSAARARNARLAPHRAVV
jgi:hypothetical protein